MTDHERARKLRAIADALELVAHELDNRNRPVDQARARELLVKLAGPLGQLNDIVGDPDFVNR